MNHIQMRDHIGHASYGAPVQLAPPTLASSPIPLAHEELMSLEAMVAELGEAFHALKDRLENSVLAPAVPAAVGDGKGEAPSPALGKLAERLHMLRFTVRSLRASVGDTIDRLQV